MKCEQKLKFGLFGKIIAEKFANVKYFLYFIGNEFEKDVFFRSLKCFTYQAGFFISKTEISGCRKSTSFFLPEESSSWNRSVKLSTSGLGTFMQTVEFGQGHVRKDTRMQVPRWQFHHRQLSDERFGRRWSNEWRTQLLIRS